MPSGSPDFRSLPLAMASIISGSAQRSQASAAREACRVNSPSRGWPNFTVTAAPQAP